MCLGNFKALFVAFGNTTFSRVWPIINRLTIRGPWGLRHVNDWPLSPSLFSPEIKGNWMVKVVPFPGELAA